MPLFPLAVHVVTIPRLGCVSCVGVGLGAGAALHVVTPPHKGLEAKPRRRQTPSPLTTYITHARSPAAGRLYQPGHGGAAPKAAAGGWAAVSAWLAGLWDRLSLSSPCACQWIVVVRGRGGRAYVCVCMYVFTAALHLAQHKTRRKTHAPPPPLKQKKNLTSNTKHAQKNTHRRKAVRWADPAMLEEAYFFHADRPAGMCLWRRRFFEAFVHLSIAFPTLDVWCHPFEVFVHLSSFSPPRPI